MKEKIKSFAIISGKVLLNIIKETILHTFLIFMFAFLIHMCMKVIGWCDHFTFRNCLGLCMLIYTGYSMNYFFSDFFKKNE